MRKPILQYTLYRNVYIYFFCSFFFFFYLFISPYEYLPPFSERILRSPSTFVPLSLFFFSLFSFFLFFFLSFFLAWGNPEIPLTTDKRIPDNSVSRRNKFVGWRKLEKKKGIEGKKGNEERVTQRAIDIIHSLFACFFA